MKKNTRATIAVAACLAIALIAACSKKKPSDTAPRPSVSAAADSASSPHDAAMDWRQLQAWNAWATHAASISRPQARLDGVSRQLSEADAAAQRAVCDALSQPAEKPAAQPGLAA